MLPASDGVGGFEGGVGGCVWDQSACTAKEVRLEIRNSNFEILNKSEIQIRNTNCEILNNVKIRITNFKTVVWCEG